MKGILRSKVTLIIVYLAMAAVCVYLNMTSESIDLSNVIVSGALFVIVLGLFIYAYRRFMVVDRMIADLNEATETIRDDFGMKKQYLWKYYRTGESLFTQDTLRKRYAEYRSEIDRLELLSGDVYRCDIEDYINQELIDDSISRNILNLMSGTMTGLGILGTFIGLTLGLQEFNTGTASEITKSIAPLIQGIKVAFHTSIYGMVFSLIFSFIYKNKLDQATEAMDRFLDTYEHYVVPDTKNENERQMLAFQKSVADGIAEIGSSFSETVGKRVDEIMTPQMNRMNDTVEKFAYVASRAQVDGVNAIVDKFLEQMNRQLSGAFTELGRAMQESVEWEKENRSYMRGLMQELGGYSQELVKTGELVEKTMSNMAEYVDWMNRINSALSENLSAVETQLAAMQTQAGEQQKYMQLFVEYTKEIGASSSTYSEQMAEQLAYLKRMDAKLSDSAKKTQDLLMQSATETMRQLADSTAAANTQLLRQSEESAETISRQMQSQSNSILRSSGAVNTELQRSTEELLGAAQTLNTQVIDSLRSTLDAYDKSLARIVGQLNTTATRIENVTSQVPQVVSDAYAGMHKSFDLLARETASMVRSMDQLRRDLKQSSSAV